jgi:hypothetical protein
MLPVQRLINQINVEVDSLKGIAAAMKQSLEQGYRTQVPAVHDAMQPGATIGAGIAGAEWMRLQDVYTTCINSTLEAIYNIDVGTQAMAQAADIIATKYGDADTLAHVKASAVDATLMTNPSGSSLAAPATTEWGVTDGR